MTVSVLSPYRQTGQDAMKKKDPIDIDSMVRVSNDPWGDSEDVPSQIRQVARRCGTLVRELANAESQYRHWAAGTARALADEHQGPRPLSADKIKILIESDPEFLVHKGDIARLAGKLEEWRGNLDALRAKRDMVRERMAYARTTYGTTDPTFDPGDQDHNTDDTEEEDTDE